jgi:hypothetical protein
VLFFLWCGNWWLVRIGLPNETGAGVQHLPTAYSHHGLLAGPIT